MNTTPTPKPLLSFRWTLHHTYLEIASYNLYLAEHSIKMEHLSFPLDGGKRPAALVYNSKRGTISTVTCIVFSAFVLEAYINDIADAYLSRAYRESVDKLPVPAKWVIVPQAAFKTTGLEPSDDLYRQLDSLFEKRNLLAHSKPYRSPMPPKITDGEEAWGKYMKSSQKHAVGLDEARAAYTTCIAALRWIEPLLPDRTCAIDKRYLTSTVSQHWEQYMSDAVDFEAELRAIAKATK